jgi:hypothetical protein
VKVKLEWQDGQVWHSAMAEVAVSRNGNFTFRHQNRRYVFREKKEGDLVLILLNGQWVKAGRVTRNGIFLGEGISSDEFYRTPQGLKAAQEALQSFYASKGR